MKIKITEGYVKQIFDDQGNFIHQEFVSSDVVNWEDENGNVIKSESYYHPFDMKEKENV